MLRKIVLGPDRGTSSADILSFLANFMVGNPDGKTLYHSALEVQFPKDGECKRYVIELTDAESDRVARARVGDTVKHNIFGPSSYTIRLFRDGEVEDKEHAKPPILLSSGCGIASNIAASVEAQDVPDLDYGQEIGTKSGGKDRWTSNSVVSWLLQRAGLNPGGIFPPDGGIAPGWDGGSTYAWDHYP